MRDMLARIIHWQRWDIRKDEWVSTNPPFEIASTILGRNGEWPFLTIDGVVTTPTMRPDGTLLLTPGYDEKTRLLLVSPPKLPTMPDQPTPDDGLAALALLEDLLEEFPFDNEVSKAVALSALITPVVRGAFMMTPAHSAKAATPASGKSYLFDVVAAIAIGIHAGDSSREKRRGNRKTHGLGADGRAAADLDRQCQRRAGRRRPLSISRTTQRQYPGTWLFQTHYGRSPWYLDIRQRQQHYASRRHCSPGDYHHHRPKDGTTGAA